MTKRRLTTNGVKFSYQWKFLCFWIDGFSHFANRREAQSFLDRMHENETRKSKQRQDRWMPIEKYDTEGG